MTDDVSVMHKYEVLAESLRRQIQDGTLKPEDRLPSFAEMRDLQGVTQPTVDRAFSLLEREGLIRRERRRGTFVQSATAVSRTRREIAGIMAHTIALLTLERGELLSSHRLAGWREFVTLGALDAAKLEHRHVLTLQPDRLMSEGIDPLVAARPFGLAVADIEEISKPLSAMLRTVHDAGIPVALYGNWSDFSDFDRVTSDHEQGAYDLTRWLIAQGRTRIVNVWSSPSSGYWFTERLAGYRRAMEEAGLPVRAPVEIPFDDTSSYTEACFQKSVRTQYVGYLIEALLGSDSCDAMMAATDGMVFSLAASCRLLKKEPNEDVLLVGYDNYWSDAPQRAWEQAYPVATVDKNNVKMGAELISLLSDRAAGILPNGPQCRRIVAELIVT